MKPGSMTSSVHQRASCSSQLPDARSNGELKVKVNAAMKPAVPRPTNAANEPEWLLPLPRKTRR